MSLSWTQPTCEACWIERNVIGMDEERIAIRMPVRVLNDEPEHCAYCGKWTIVGIYTRDNPANVRFPREKEE